MKVMIVKELMTGDVSPVAMFHTFPAFVFSVNSETAAVGVSQSVIELKLI